MKIKNTGRTDSSLVMSTRSLSMMFLFIGTLAISFLEILLLKIKMLILWVGQFHKIIIRILLCLSLLM